MAARDFPAAAGDLSGLVRQNSREIARLIPWEISQNTLRHPRGDLPAAKFRRMRSPGNDISKETAAWNPPGNAGVVRRKIMRLPGEPHGRAAATPGKFPGRRGISREINRPHPIFLDGGWIALSRYSARKFPPSAHSITAILLLSTYPS